MSSRNQRKLRNFLIDPRYQLKYAGLIVLTGALVLLLNASVFYWFIRENYTLLVDMSPMEDDAKAQLYRELHQTVFALSGISIGFLLVIALLAVILTHRTAGPMYHFRRVFREIQEGKTQARIHLRPHDDFQEVARECNRALDYLHKNRD